MRQRRAVNSVGYFTRFSSCFWWPTYFVAARGKRFNHRHGRGSAPVAQASVLARLSADVGPAPASSRTPHIDSKDYPDLWSLSPILAGRLAVQRKLH